MATRILEMFHILPQHLPKRKQIIGQDQEDGRRTSQTFIQIHPTIAQMAISVHLTLDRTYHTKAPHMEKAAM
jgi:hypothetical protein